MAYQLHHNTIEQYNFARDGVVYGTNENMANRHEIGLSTNYNGCLFKNWYISANVEPRYIYTPNGYIKKDILQWFASLFNTLTLSSSLQAELNLRYVSPWIQQSAWIGDQFSSEVGLRYASPNKRWIVGCQLSNLIGKRTQTRLADNQYIKNSEVSQVALPRFMFQVTYRFQTEKKVTQQQSAQYFGNRSRI